MFLNCDEHGTVPTSHVENIVSHEDEHGTVIMSHGGEHGTVIMATLIPIQLTAA